MTTGKGNNLGDNLPQQHQSNPGSSHKGRYKPRAKIQNAGNDIISSGTNNL